MTQYSDLSYTQNSINKQPKDKFYVSTSIIIAIAFGSVFFSRVLDSLGAPSLINFAHFAIVPFATWVALTKSRIRDQYQKNLVYTIIICLLIFLCIILTSTMLNDAGIINAVLSFLLWGEPFLLILSILCLPTELELLKRLKTWLLSAFVFHTFLAFFQHYVLRVQYLPGAEDNIQGVFYRSGSGHVVGASVAISFGLYWLISGRDYPLWMRGAFLLATFWHMLMADAKQVLLSLVLGGVLLLLTKMNNIVEVIKYLVLSLVFGSGFYWCIENLVAFRAFKTWIRPEIYGPEGEATLLKSASLRIIPTFYHSPLNFLFGLGPGHTVDRLGGWMLREYWHLLGPLGATTYPASKAVWQAVAASWLGDQSSMFSPLFGWAAIWGDFGVIGLGAYLGLCIVTYQLVCIDDISKLMAFSVMTVGLIFSQMQEPGYMLSIAAIISLRWHELRIEKLADETKEMETEEVW
ncbi:MAG: hypothetical protein ACO3NK_00160 [Prochlorotrichaceae cyanobacterium]|jgi:hypothetical protein